MCCKICVEFKGFLCKMNPVPCAFILSLLKLQLVCCFSLHIHCALHSRANASTMVGPRHNFGNLNGSWLSRKSRIIGTAYLVLPFDYWCLSSESLGDKAGPGSTCPSNLAWHDLHSLYYLEKAIQVRCSFISMPSRQPGQPSSAPPMYSLYYLEKAIQLRFSSISMPSR